MRLRFFSSALSRQFLVFRYPIFFRDGESAIISNEVLEPEASELDRIVHASLPNHSAQIFIRR
jgi:hypothetical protein